MVDARRRSVLASVALAVLVAACGGSTGTTPPPAPSSTASQQPGSTAGGSSGPAGSATTPGTSGSSSVQNSAVPQFAHVYLMVLENKAFDSIVGSSQAPYLNQLIAKYGLATNYLAVAHPSQPNYLALFSGSTQGVTDDGVHHLSAQNLADQLASHGKTWRMFAQDYPGGCFQGSSKSGGGEGIGTAGDYVRKHVPALSFTDISANPARCANVQNLAQFDPAAASFEMIVPNTCNDMHSCGVDVGDAFAAAFVPRIINSAAFANSVLFITTDEGTSDAGGGGRVATIVVSPLVHPGFTSSTFHSHYSLLRTIQDAWGLGCLAQTCSANNLAEFFH